MRLRKVIIFIFVAIVICFGTASAQGFGSPVHPFGPNNPMSPTSPLYHSSEDGNEHAYHKHYFNHKIYQPGCRFCRYSYSLNPCVKRQIDECKKEHNAFVGIFMCRPLYE